MAAAAAEQDEEEEEGAIIIRRCLERSGAEQRLEVLARLRSRGGVTLPATRAMQETRNAMLPLRGWTCNFALPSFLPPFASLLI